METVEYRLSTLESVLAEFIMQQNRNLTRMERSIIDLKEEMSDFKNEMSVFKNEMSDFKNEMLDFKNEMSDFKNEMSDFKNEMSDYKEEGKRERKEMNVKWGQLSNRLGTFSEDMVAPNIPRLAREQFGVSHLDVYTRNMIKTNPNDISQSFEFDVIVVNNEQKKAILVECKFTVRMEYLRDMTRIADNFRAVFPEYADYELISIFASMSIKEDQIKFLTSNNIYAMALGEENMELLNYEELSNK